MGDPSGPLPGRIELDGRILARPGGTRDDPCREGARLSPSIAKDGSGDIGRRSLEELREVLRSSIHERLRGARAADPRDVEEALIQLLAYALSLEYIICQVSKRESTIPGHNVSVRGYVEQVLSGESSEVAWRRLSEYLRDAQHQLFQVAMTRDKALDDFAQVVLEEFSPQRIEEQVRPTLFQMVRGRGHAYWAAFFERYHHMDASGLRQLAERKARATNGQQE